MLDFFTAVLFLNERSKENVLIGISPCLLVFLLVKVASEKKDNRGKQKKRESFTTKKLGAGSPIDGKVWSSTLPEMDGWKVPILSFWGPRPIFRGYVCC